MAKKRKSATPSQLNVLIYMAKSMAEKGVQPSIREIGRAFEISSPNGVVCHLKGLERHGLIVRLPLKARSIVIPNYKEWARRKISNG